MQNFALNERSGIVENRLVDPNQDGLPVKKCWKVLVDLLVKIAFRVYGIPSSVATLLVMSSAIFVNRTPIDGPFSWCSSRSTRPHYDASATVTDPLVKSLFGRMFDQMTN